uniref:hypothetical protein n=1 Tax=Prevotella heparinolytica TaxID=28113 RepID=UPI0035A08B1D
MEKEIKKTTAHVKVAFACFWMISILLVISGEMGSSWVGLYVENISATYMAETITILLTASCVPISLKLFSWVLTRKIDIAALPKALRLYALWSDIRLILLSLPVLTGFFTYYMMLSTTGVLCGMIGLSASLFCLP